MTRRRQLTLPGAGLVEGTLEALARRDRLTSHLDWLEPDDGEVNKRHLWIRVFNALLLVVPLGTLHEHAMDVDANLRYILNFIAHHFQDVSPEIKRIDWFAGVTSVSLHSGCHETLREEECGYPECLRWSLVNPV